MEITDANKGDIANIISAEDLNNGKLVYKHDGGETTSDNFLITIHDNSKEGGGNKSSSLEVGLVVRAINDPPELKDNVGATVTESAGDDGKTYIYGEKMPDGQPVPAGQPRLYSIDTDNDPKEIIYRITEPSTHGTLYRDGVPLGVGSCFSQKDLDDGLIYYQHSGKNQHDDTFKFVVTDNSLYHNNANDGGKTAEPVTYDITVRPVNEQPYFNGMERLDVYYKFDQDAILIWDKDTTEEIKRFIQIGDPDRDAERGYLSPAESEYNDYMELTITATSRNNGGAVLEYGELEIRNKPTGLTIDPPSQKTNTLVLKGTMADINEALKNLYFQATSDGQTATIVNTDLDDIIDIHFDVNDCNNGMEADGDNLPTKTADDPQKETARRTVTIYVSTDNDAPEPDVGNYSDSSPIAMREDTTWYIFNSDGSDGRATLSFSDPDAFDSDSNTLTIYADNGRISLAEVNIPGLADSNYDNGKLVLTGTLDALNEAIYQLQYRANSQFNGDDVIHVVFSDAGNTGPLKDDGITPEKVNTLLPIDFNVYVEPVNDAPTAEALYTDKGYADGFERHKDQVAGGKFTPTAEITDSNQVDYNYELSLKGKIHIDDVNDLKNYANGLTGDNHAIEVTVSAEYLRGGGAIGSFTGDFSAIENDVQNSITFSATPDDANGKITLTGTWDQVQRALDALKYVLNSTEAGACQNQMVNITVTVDDKYNDTSHASGHNAYDGGSTASTNFLVNVNTGPNEAPKISGGDTTPVIYEDLYFNPSANNRISLTDLFKGTDVLKVSDDDCFSEKMLFKLEINGGTLYLDGNEFDGSTYYADLAGDGQPVWNAAGATVNEINGILSRLVVKVDDNFNGDLKIILTVNDKGHTGSVDPGDPKLNNGGLETSKTVTVKVLPVNDVPVVKQDEPGTVRLDDGGGRVPVEEDTPSARIPGYSVENLFGGHFTDPKDFGDHKSGLAGVYVVGNEATAGEGTWQYSTDGSDWNSIPTDAGDAKALFLDKNTQVRFVPALDFYGEPGKLTVRLVETDVDSVPQNNDGTSPYKPFFGTDSITGKPLTTGATFDLTTDFGTIDANFRPYTIDTVDLTTVIKADNDAPTITVPDNYTMNEDGSLSLTGITIADPDIRPGEEGGLGYPSKLGDNSYSLVITASGNGKLGIDPSYSLPAGVTLNWDTGTNTFTISGATFAQLKALVEGGKITFTPNTDFHSGESGGTKVGLTFTIKDGGNIGPNPSNPDKTGTDTTTVTVTPVNDAPWVKDNNSDTEAITQPFDRIEAITPDSDLPTKTVEELFSGYYYDGKDTDQNDGPTGHQTFAGVTLEYNSPSNAVGTWQYSDDGGTSWSDLPDLNSSEGFYLNKDAALRFKPTGNGTTGDSPELKAHLVDNSDGRLDDAAGKVTLTGQTGGTKDTSINSVKLSTPVVVVQRPAWKDTAPAEIDLTDILEDVESSANNGDTVGNLINGKFTDIGNDGLAGVLITGVGDTNGQGTWKYSTDGGNAWQTISLDTGKGLFLETGTKIRFEPNLDWNGEVTGKLTIHLVDNGNGLDGPSVPANESQIILTDMGVGSSDQSNRYSPDSRDLTITVKPVNDAPEATRDAVTLPDQKQSAGQSQGYTVEELFQNIFTDCKDQVPGHPGNSFNGVFVNGSLADPATEGVWQYYDGGNWHDLDPADLSDAKAIYLDPTAKIRFQPVAGYVGSPGELTVRLAETNDLVGDQKYTGEFTELPNNGSPVSGQEYNLTGRYGDKGHISADTVAVKITIAAEPTDDVVYQRPPEEKDPVRWGVTSPSINEGSIHDWEGFDFPVFERLGLDDAHSRTGSGMDGQHQEVGLITDVHVSNVSQFTTDHVHRSVSNAHDVIGRGGASGLADFILTAGGADLVYTPGESGGLYFDKSYFETRLPEVTLTYQLALADGGDVPAWLAFDGENLSLTCLDAAAKLEEELELILTATCPEGRTVTATLRLTADDLRAMLAESVEPAGPPTDNLEPVRDDLPADEDSPEKYLIDAAASFEDIWAEASADEAAESLPGDADLDRKMAGCALESLLVESQKLISLIS